MNQPDKFRFATLLKIRENARDLLRSELGQQMTRVNDVQQELHLADQQIEEHQTDWEKTQQNGMLDVGILTHYFEYFKVLRKKRDEIEARLQETLSILETKRSQLEEATNAVKVLENLKKRQHETDVTNELRQEALLLDELARQQITSQ